MSRTPTAVALVTAALLGLGGAMAPVHAAEPRLGSTALVVSWPAGPLPWNTVAYVTARVSPGQTGRSVRLDIWGMGGPGWSRLDRRTTDATGMVRLRLFTLCPDSPCGAVTDRYRVVVLPGPGVAGAQAVGTVRVVP